MQRIFIFFAFLFDFCLVSGYNNDILLNTLCERLYIMNNNQEHIFYAGVCALAVLNGDVTALESMFSDYNDVIEAVLDFVGDSFEFCDEEAEQIKELFEDYDEYMSICYVVDFIVLYGVWLCC